MRTRQPVGPYPRPLLVAALVAVAACNSPVDASCTGRRDTPWCRMNDAALAAEIETSGGKAVAIQGDVSKPQDIQRLFSEIKKQFGHVDVLVNNAGIYEFAPLESITHEHITKHSI